MIDPGQGRATTKARAELQDELRLALSAEGEEKLKELDSLFQDAELGALLQMLSLLFRDPVWGISAHIEIANDLISQPPSNGISWRATLFFVPEGFFQSEAPRDSPDEFFSVLESSAAEVPRTKSVKEMLKALMLHPQVLARLQSKQGGIGCQSQ